MARAVRSQFVAADLVWIATIRYAGQTYRLASEPVSITSSTPLASETIRHDSGLVPLDDIVQALAGLASLPDVRSLSVEVVWDDVGTATALSELIQQGHDLAAGRGEVALWIRGTAYEDRIVLVDGRLETPEYGGPGEGITLTISDEPWADTSTLTTSTATLEAWPTVYEQHEGAPYPWVVGNPGVYDSGYTQSAGSPAICVAYTSGADTLLIAGHHVAAKAVSIAFDTGTTITSVAALTVVNTYDGLGRPCATVDVTGAGAALRAAVEWWVRWDAAGALLSPYRANAAIETVGELLRYLADRATVRTDPGGWASLAELLPWPIGGFVDDPAVSPMQLLNDAILPILPIGIGVGDRGGLVPILWRYDAASRDAIDHWEVGPGISRVGRVRYERAPDETVQRIRVEWAFDLYSKGYRSVTVLTPGEREEDETTSAFCRAAALRYVRPGEPIRTKTVSSPWIWQSRTAARVAHWQIRRDGYSPRLVDYDVLSDRAWIRPGDVITLTDAELALSSTVALVVARRISDAAMWTYTLQILDGLASDAIEAGPGANGEPTWTGT